ncbi:MAG: hypothetical protein RIQ93_345 [Verrucomicrobiota bacterium]|jgi:LAO/AO transport system kinase
MSEPAVGASRWTALDARQLGRLLSAIEERSAEASRVIAELQAGHWPGITVGITGPPGCGKSTLIAALIRELRRRGQSIGILAIDPSSLRNGGALLGDRVRMMDFATDPRVLIRSVAARGSQGGVAPGIADMARLLRAAGFTWVFIETLGVGQGELDIAAQADLTVVVQAPGSGDDIQAMKKGLLEIAQLIVVNKADLAGADQVVRDLAAWTVSSPDQICRTSAVSGEGIAALVDAMERHPRPDATVRATADSRRAEIRRLALMHLTRRLEQRLRGGPLPEGDTWQAAERIVAEMLSDHGK